RRFESAHVVADLDPQRLDPAQELAVVQTEIAGDLVHAHLIHSASDTRSGAALRSVTLPGVAPRPASSVARAAVIATSRASPSSSTATTPTSARPIKRPSPTFVP